MLGLVVPTAAFAADIRDEDAGLTLYVDYGNESVDGTTLVRPGTTYTARLQYDTPKQTNGGTVTITVPEGVIFPSGVPAGNEAVDSVTFDGNTHQLTVTFKDDVESGNYAKEGMINFSFTLTKPEDGTARESLTWGLPNVDLETEVIVTDPGSYDPKPGDFRDGLNKRVETPGFNGAITYDAAEENITVDPKVTQAGALKYTITLDVKGESTFDLTDVIDDRLAYDAGSFTATITTWSELGDKKTEEFALPTEQIDGNTLTIAGISVAEDARIVVTYTAHVLESAIDEIETLLKDGAEGDRVGGVDEVNSETGGDIWVKFGNTAKGKDSIEGSADARLGTHIDAEPQPGVGPAFGKKLDSEKQTVLNPEGETDDDDNPVLSRLPLETDYTITTDLRSFANANNGWNGKWELTDDVIVRDTLPDGIRWKSVASDPALTEIAPEIDGTVTEDAFLEASDAGQYWIDADTNTLWVNVGRDVSTAWKINVTTVIDDADALAKLCKWNKNDPQVAAAYCVENSAQFFYWDGRNGGHAKHEQSRKADNRDLFIVQDKGSAIDDDKAFDKKVGQIGRMKIGEAYQVPFIFDIGDGALVDLAKSQIIDTVNHEVFNVTDANLDAIRGTITAKYADNIALTGDDFDLSLNETGKLVFQLNTNKLDGVKNDDGFLDRKLHVEFALPTFVVTGKKTLDISNSARVEGGTLREYTWKNDAKAESTSYGDEMEVQKYIYDGVNKEWTRNLRVQLDENGDVVAGQTYVYRIELIPHGSYQNVRIFDIDDVLPEGLKPLGFVNDANLGGDSVDAVGTTDLEGNLRATFSGNTLKISQREGTTLPGGVRPHVNFKVELTSAEPNVGIVNKIPGSVPTVITNTNGYPLVIAKTDSQRPNVTINDREARFTVTGPNGFEETNVFVVDGQLMTLDDKGDEVGIVVPGLGGEGAADVPVGEYCITEVAAPKGYEKIDADCAAIATIKADGSSEAVTLNNDPKPLYAIGDYTWIDNNRNGQQDDGEPALAGVTVELLQGGKVVDTTTTDDKGFYLFDFLEAGDYKVRFTLGKDDAKEYTFTDALQGDDVARNSDAGENGESGTITLGKDDDGNELNTNLVKYDKYDHEFGAYLGIDPTWDAGVVKKSYAIGDYTWIDSDRDGTQTDADGNPEKPLSHVTVKLTDEDGNEVKDVLGNTVAEQQTGEDGYYLFDNLEAGTYKVTFVLNDDEHAGYTFTKALQGDDVAKNSDADQKTGESKLITLGDDNEYLAPETGNGTAVKATQGVDPTWDAGVVGRTYAVGDYVWIDENHDGIQDEGEDPLAGVEVNLLVGGEVVDTTHTDKDGRYLFDNLDEGDYQIEFVLTDAQQAKYIFTHSNVDPDDTDSDADAKGLTEVFHLGPGTVTKDYDDQEFGATEGIDPTWDAGVVFKTYAIGDYTWIDTNRDGLQGDDEPVLANVTVELLDADGNSFDEPLVTKTDANGYYLFDMVPAGEYTLKFTLNGDDAVKYTFTDALKGGEDSKATDSDAKRGSGLTEPFTVGYGTVVKGEDFEAYKAAHPDTKIKASVGVDPTWDAGVVEKTYAIGDYTWIDANKDGVQNDDEVLAGVKVELLLGSDVVDETVTDENGLYRFDNLPAGEYQVRFTLTPEQSELYVYTFPNSLEEGTGPNKNSDAVVSGDDQAVAITVPVTLDDSNDQLVLGVDGVEATEGIDPTWDAGVFARSYAIGDVVWVDENGNGLQDDEEALEGVVVELLGETSDEVIATTKTDENGHYLFDELPAGNYRVKFTLTDEQAKEYNFTGKNAEIGGEDSDADPATGITDVIELKHGAENLTTDYEPAEVKATDGIDPTWDAGVVHKTYAVGDYTWIDTNRDGVQNEGEPVLPGVIVELLDADGKTIDTTTTDENGRYMFDELRRGDYKLRFVLTDEQAVIYSFTDVLEGDDTSADSNATRPSGLTVPFTLDGSNGSLIANDAYEFGDVRASEGIDPTWDAGVIVKRVSVGDRVWHDKNKNGQQDDGEPGIPGVCLELVGPDGKPVVDVDGNPVGPVKTDENGNYSFDNLPALPEGEHYSVKLTCAPEGFEPTKPGAGDRDKDSSTDVAESEDLTNDGDRDDTLDFGFIKPSVSVGDKVWFDEDGDGVQDKNEPGIPGVCLELVGPDGKPVVDVDGNPVGPVKTDENGNYSFENLPVLPEGQHYTVKVTCVPEGYEPTKPGVGDRDKDSSTNEAESTDLTEDGQRDDTLDFGFVKTPEPEPTPEPTEEPSPEPSVEPTEEPTPAPTEEPSVEPTPVPTEEPTPAPTEEPSVEPSPAPTDEPSEEPSPVPTDEPTPAPSTDPTPAPAPSPAPSEQPKDDLRPTGADMALPLGALGVIMLLGGAVVYTMRRRAQQ